MKRPIKAILISIAASLFLSGLQFFMAFLSGSLVILADAWHSATDVVSSLFVFLGLKLQSYLDTKSEQARKWGTVFENLIALCIGVAIIWAAVVIASKAFIYQATEIKYLWLILPVTGLSLVITFLIASYKIRTGNETNTYNLVADGLHSWSDMLSTFVLLVTLLGRTIGMDIDKIASFIISAIILKTGVSVVLKAIRALWKREKIYVYGNSSHFKSQPSAWQKRILNKIAGEESRLRAFMAVLSPAVLSERLYKRSEPLIQWIKVNPAKTLSSLVIFLSSIYLLSGFSMVPIDSLGTKLRFGKIVADKLDPGLYYYYPSPIGKILSTQGDNIRRVEVGFRTRPKDQVEFIDDDFAYMWEFRSESGLYVELPEEGGSITGDEYYINTQAVVQYKVREPAYYLFQVKDIDNLIRYAAMEYLGSKVNTTKMDEILIISRKEIEKELKHQLQHTMDTFQTGVQIYQVCFRDVHPPVDVVPAFREVASAKEDRKKMINQAYGFKNEIIPISRGKAAQTINQAERKANKRIQLARGITQRFTLKESAYRLAPRLTQRRLYLSTAEKVLADMEKLIAPTRFGKKSMDYRQMYMFDKFFNRKLGSN
ncbi:MAG: FtsH protease activity modulator HflK [Fibrobacteria bacterium]|nr:FtsH protease activity modulator HflK [Fibrobacteria bacterium]